MLSFSSPPPIREALLGQLDCLGRRLLGLLGEALQGQEHLLESPLGREQHPKGLILAVDPHLVDVAAQVARRTQAEAGDVTHAGEDLGRVCIGEVVDEPLHRLVAGLGLVVAPLVAMFGCVHHGQANLAEQSDLHGAAPSTFVTHARDTPAR